MGPENSVIEITFTSEPKQKYLIIKHMWLVLKGIRGNLLP